MKKRSFIALMCCFMVLSLSFMLCGFTTGNVAHAEEGVSPIVVGETYTFSDSGGEYSVTILTETEYKLHAVKEGDEIEYKGTYTYIDGKLTLSAAGDVLGVFYLQGSNLVKVVESEETPPENNTFLGRVQAWLEENYVGLATTIGDIVLFILFLVNFFKNKKNLLGLAQNVKFTSNAQSDVVDVVNNLIVGYNTIEAEFKEYKKTESQNYEIVGSMIIQTKAILEILTTVYANSKNLPQGVKDLVNLKYADALKKLGEVPALKEVVDDAVAQLESAETETTPENTTTEG